MHRQNKLAYEVVNETTGKAHTELYRQGEEPQRHGYKFIAKARNKARRIYKDRWIEVITWIE